MDARSILAKKRDGTTLNAEELRWFAAGLASGHVSDAQAGAFAMATLLNGMSDDERVGLTLAMRDSGDVQSWHLPGPVLDKHSTGGIGDNVSLILAPALAAIGAYVPMISGRGLGHTGGTLDKLDAIPGYQSEVDVETMRRITRDVGCAIVGAAGPIAPADKRLYAIRDVTGTVESIDLITASILSKKLAAGLEGLVLDVKIGSGAFLPRPEEGQKLAQALVSVANGAGCPTAALITDMNAPLASSAGNGLEVKNAIDLLLGHEIDNRLWDVTVALGGVLLELGGLCERAAEGQTMIAAALEDGRAAEKFAAMITALGGPADLLERPQKYLPKAAVIGEVCAPRSGFVSDIDGRALGLAVVDLGGGRHREGDALDSTVGLEHIADLGRFVEKGDPLAVVHAASAEALERAKTQVGQAIKMAETCPDERQLILQRVG